MHILLLTQIVPYPPDSGPKVKTYHVLRYLAEHGHRVTLATFVRKTEADHANELRPYCDQIYAVPLQRSHRADIQAYAQGLASSRPFLITRDAMPAMYQLVRQLFETGNYDFVHADQLTMAQFALAGRMSNGKSPHSPAIIFDAHNAVWTIIKRSSETAPLFLRRILSLEAQRIKQYEGRLIQEFDQTLAVSAVDSQALLQAASGRENQRLASKISIIPIAVDCAKLQPVHRSAKSPTILTVGTLFYPPNADGVRWFIREVFPRVREKLPAASLNVVGPRPPKDIVQAGLGNRGVAVTGYIPDLTPYFESAAIMIVPVRAGSGMRVRILEALSRGMPLVTTTTGVEGIDAVDGEHLLVADGPGEFARAVVRLLEDQEFGKRLGRNGRRLIEKKYDWNVVLPNLEQVYESLSHRQ